MKRLDLLMKMIRYHLKYMNTVLGHQPRGLWASHLQCLWPPHMNVSLTFSFVSWGLLSVLHDSIHRQMSCFSVKIHRSIRDGELFWSICTEAVPNHDTTIDAFGLREHFRGCGHSTLQEVQTAKVLGTCFWFLAANSGLLLWVTKCMLIDATNGKI